MIMFTYSQISSSNNNFALLYILSNKIIESTRQSGENKMNLQM